MRSPHYAGTLHLNDPLYDEKVDCIRLYVCEYNKKARAIQKSNSTPQKQYRVFFRGRLGVNNNHLHLYRRGGRLHRHSSQDIRPEHAGYFDVYVYRKYT
jgi:hypothetical protein